MVINHDKREMSHLNNNITSYLTPGALLSTIVLFQCFLRQLKKKVK